MATTAKETKNETASTVKNEWEELREITLPRGNAHEPKNLYVSINGRTFNVPKNGKPQKVPYPVYERLVIMLESEANVEDFIEKMPNKEAAA